MNIGLYLVLSYLLAVFIYTIVIKNDAMHKNDPFLKTFSVVKEGLRDMAIGFLITIVILGAIIGGLILYNNLRY